MSNRASRRRSGRRRGSPVRSTPAAELPDIFVGTFADALAGAAALVDEFERAFVGYTLDARGQVVGGLALTAAHHRMEEVVLMVLAGDPPAPGTGVLLLSADRDVDVMTLQEEDELRWGSFRRIFAARGYQLWDWIKTDGENFRSLHLGSEGAGAWPAPALDIRPRPV